jgi:hypothetical protein
VCLSVRLVVKLDERFVKSCYNEMAARPTVKLMLMGLIAGGGCGVRACAVLCCAVLVCLCLCLCLSIEQIIL